MCAHTDFMDLLFGADVSYDVAPSDTCGVAVCRSVERCVTPRHTGVDVVLQE